MFLSVTCIFSVVVVCGVSCMPHCMPQEKTYRRGRCSNVLGNGWCPSISGVGQISYHVMFAARMRCQAGPKHAMVCWAIKSCNMRVVCKFVAYSMHRTAGKIPYTLVKSNQRAYKFVVISVYIILRRFIVLGKSNMPFCVDDGRRVCICSIASIWNIRKYHFFWTS
jgi:hypothetical protein